jgi:hypothetical protein
MVLEKDEGLVIRFSDPDPMARWLVIQAVERKRSHLEEPLIGLLNDDYPQIREAAHKALVRLARGTDFGPAANASSVQRTKAIQSWRSWLAMQTVSDEAKPSPGLSR